MILLDANVIVLDMMYPSDVNHTLNQQVLSMIAARAIPRGMVMHGLLEVAGKLSFNTPSAVIPTLLTAIPNRYGLVIPDPNVHDVYAGLSVSEVMTEISIKMGVGDAVQAAQIRKFLPTATALLTWNAKHFTGRLAIPVMTPSDWLNQQTQGITP